MKNISKPSTFCLQNVLYLLLLCLFFLVEYLAVPVSGDTQLTPYSPIENITIDCGSSTDGQARDGRRWIGDGNGKFSPREQKSNDNNKPSVLLKALERHLSVENIPYAMARLSYSEFTYPIPLTAGQKFLRLYFYPTSYPGFDDTSNKAIFSVKAGRFTLLSNFSASLHAQGERTVIKEFCLNVDESQTLNLTFTPSPDISDSYAFINGFEIISMPTNLYYRPASDEGVTFLGQGNLYPIGNDSALEMVHRVNIGGQQISTTDDTGMYRSWKSDDPYLVIANPSALPVNVGVNLTFSDKPSFSAPRNVYVTARSMGNNKTVNENYNLTWEFPVDSGFNYFVRLHFCEFQGEIAKEGDRVFEIFLANLTAESQADVIVWTGGNGIPTYRDYAVAMRTKRNQKQQNLSIALHPVPEWRTLYSDAILNGLEIFKLSKNFDLSGPNPDRILINQPRSTSSQSKHSKNNNKTIIGIVGGLLAGFVVLSVMLYLIFWRKTRAKDSGSTKSTKIELTYILPSNMCRYFSLEEIKAATNNFESAFIIGSGGFGNVYKAFIDDGSKAVAIKRLNPGSQQGAHEFRTEIEMLSQLRHRNLVSLIGYCEDNNEMILVYDYMVHGALRDHLYKTNKPRLDWEQRLRICIGAAHGLNYLHRGPNHNIIHRDVKTANILLGEKWVAKVADFGLSKMNNLSRTHISTIVKGSFGYLDPEYHRLLRLTEKSDVYSFGVVLCEVLCARAAVDPTADHMQISLAEWAKYCHNNGNLGQIIDPYLQSKISPASLQKFAEVAINCLAFEGIKRPAMSEVVCGLELALKLQENEMNANAENLLNDSTLIDYHVLFTSGSGSMNTGR